MEKIRDVSCIFFSHMVREGNVVANDLSKHGAAGLSKIYLSASTLPLISRGAYQLDRFGYDLYVSAEHRVVVNSEKERFSIPFFFFPSHYAAVKPLEELVNEQNPAKYKEYNWGKYYVNRTGSNYKKLDAENVQIHHFKTSE
ncbi:hypothetical protein REPUB_Repub02eG0178500 [Reevesia pubescens]